MKKIITLMFCIGTTLLFAQNIISTVEEEPNWPFMLSNLNTSQITSGVLLDKISDFSVLTNYNTTETNISDSEHFIQSINELYNASDRSRFISDTDLISRTAATKAINTVDVGMINTTFHRLNFNEDNPSAGGLKFENGRFVPISGRPSFVSKKIIVAAPLKDIVYGTTINFNFNNTLIFNNATTTIKTLTVKFEENATNVPVTIITNGNIVVASKSITYPFSGMKLLEFTTTFSDNTTITTFGKIFVKVDSGEESRGTSTLCTEPLRERGMYPSTPAEFSASIPFPNYGETVGIYGRIEYTAFYAYGNDSKKMRKPLILVDGFDPRDKRKVQNCDCENDPTCFNANSTTTYNPITYPHYTSTFNSSTYESIEKSMEYDGNSPDGLPVKVSLLDDLRKLGYDVIIINQPTYDTKTENGVAVTGVDGGADYIERNALALVSFIKNYIKAQQAVAGVPVEPLILVGPSMGGQITRYALAYMEKQFALTGDVSWKHNARLWVSVDSPHLGANIPVGAQANIWFMGYRLSKTAAKKQYEDLNSIAGQQQSISNFEYARTSTPGYLQGSPFFTKYYSNVNSNGVAGSGGFPVSVPGTFRKIAMANGSLTGLKQGIESQEFLNMRVYARGFFGSSITFARFKDNFAPSYNATRTVFQGDGQNFRVPYNWNTGHPRYTLRVTNNDIRGSHDVVPGGSFLIGKYLKDAIDEGSGGFRTETGAYIPSNSFIASFSALAHLSPNQNWSNPLNTNLTCPSNKQTPFDTYYGSNTNTPHISFSKEGVDWLKQELAGNEQAPHFPVSQDALTGAAVVCQSATQTYTIADMCKVPSPATFTVSGNLAIVPGTATAYSVTVKAISDVAGEGKIIATFQNGQTLEKTVHTGAPSVPLYSAVEGPNWIPRGSSGGYYVNAVPLATSYVWTIVRDAQDAPCPTGTTTPRFTDNGSTTYETNATSVSVNWGTCLGNYYVSCQAKNECGTSYYRERFIYVGNPKDNPCQNNGPTFKISPNPYLSGTVVLNIAENQLPCTYDPQTQQVGNNNSTVNVKINNFFGQEVFNNVFPFEQTITIQNLSLPSGMYVVTVTTLSGQVMKEQMIVL